MEIELKEWMVPIIFEGVELSPISIVIDQLGMYGVLPGLSEETSKWLWHFTICHGVKNTDSTDNVIKHVKETLSILNAEHGHVLETVSKIFDGDFSEDFLDLWVCDLTNILNASKNKSTCTWTAKESK
jgi:phenylpropionate dioxygenase-like ring-hydroxylating dioxygenase large terminal subunit